MTSDADTEAPDREPPTPVALLVLYAVLAAILIAVLVIVGVYGV